MTIIEKLNEAYSQKALGEAGEPWRPRPSQLGGCLREAAWLLSGLPREARSPESLRLLELGTQRGEALEALAKSCWPDAEVQVPVSIPVPWGVMEGTVDLWIPTLRTIVDFKTAGAYSMGLILASHRARQEALRAACSTCHGEGYVWVGGAISVEECPICHGELSSKIVSGEKQDEGYALQLNAYRHGIWEKRGTLYPDSAPLSLLHDIDSIRTVLVYEAKDSDARKGVTAGMLYEVEIPYTAALEEAYSSRLKSWEDLLAKQRSGSLDPLSVEGMPKDAKGKPHWKCRCSPDGRPLYCSVGPVRGSCE